MDNRPIGVFDSGLGGLTVLKEIKRLLPSESLIYFGDCGRTPYGIKSKDTIIKYTFQDIRFLLGMDIKMLVIACNTASAHSYELVVDKFHIPVVEVIRPGGLAAANSTKCGKVGVIGTSATIESGCYTKAIQSIDRNIEVFSKACPLFVNLVEEGWWDNDIALRVAEEYLAGFVKSGIDTLVLGCTHYPLLSGVISSVLGSGVKLVSSAFEAAKAVKGTLEDRNISAGNMNKPGYKFFTSDSIDKFRSLGSIILGEPINCIERVNIEEY